MRQTAGPTRRPQTLAVTRIIAAALNPALDRLARGLRAGGVGRGCRLIVVVVVPVCRPFSGVAGHVQRSVGRRPGEPRTHRGRASQPAPYLSFDRLHYGEIAVGARVSPRVW